MRILNLIFAVFTVFFLIKCRVRSSVPVTKAESKTTNTNVPAPEIKCSIVYQAGKEGYNFYRIPAIVKAPNSALLAFAEGRKSLQDFGQIHILLKRSTDNGKTWQKAVAIATNDTLQTDDPVPVVDNTDPQHPDGRIFLFYCTGNKPETEVVKLNGVKEVWLITSDDNGVTWSKPANITLQVHHPYQPNFNSQYKDPLKWGYYATGPGHGLQITTGPHKGRLVVPINHSVWGKGNYATFFYSDDHGKSFHLAADLPMQTGETTVAELANDRILLNSRNQYLQDQGKKRILSFGNNSDITSAGTWRSSFHASLTEPTCQGSMINFTAPNQQKVILFSNPNSSTRREKLSVKQSKDDGITWSEGFLIDSTSHLDGYSDLVLLAGNQIGILHEADDFKAIQFCSFDYKNIPK